MPPKVYKNYIKGEWVEARCGKGFENLNPADKNDVVGLFPASDKCDLDAAVDTAKQAFKSWRLVPPPKRAEVLFRAAQVLVERKEELARDMTREMGKVLRETRGDVQEAIDMGFYMAGEGRRLFGQTTTSELPHKFAMSIRQPIGVVGVITPWNFPLAIPAWKIFPALVAGNTVVFKPASDTPLSAYHLVKILNEAGLPKGVLNLVTGSGGAVGVSLMTHPDVGVITFTGSTEVGREVSKACAPDFRHCHLEMGGKNIILVMEDANIDLALDGALWGGFGTTGQRCTAASRLGVHKKIYKQFVAKFVERAKNLKVGNGLDPSVEMGPCINDRQAQSVHNYVGIGKNEGAQLLCGGEPLTGGEYDLGAFYAPTIFGDCHPKMRIAQEEIFGPVVSVIPFESFEEAIEIANGVVYGLSSSIYTRDVNRVFTAMRDLSTGIVYVNAPTIGAEIHLPFGGTKQTGNGHREAGTAALDVFTEWKAVYVDFSGALQRAQIDTHT
ncbi:aldehyde dehydrogenase family protein [Acidobacteriia bacterium AH_259_A11_L15]|nr:aldehyde dehydrogenase family protein [Acidobacteriia bacterium AH_259_A11_L15]